MGAGNVRFDVDYQNFGQAIRFYATSLGKLVPEVCNRQSRSFLIKLGKSAVHPQGSRYKIVSDLDSLYRKDLVRLTFAYAKAMPNRNGGKPRIKFNWGKGNKRTKKSQTAMRQAIRKVYKMRLNALGYIMRGWRQLGPTFGAWNMTKAYLSGNRRKIGGTVAYPATIHKTWTFMRNGARGAGEVSYDAVNAALKDTIDDMTEYTLKKLKEKAGQANFYDTY